MKLLLMCYECSPYVGSEWAVGWGRLLGAARVAETHVVTSADNFRQLVRAHAEGLIPSNVRIHTPEPDAKLRKLEQTPGVYAYNYRAYKHWQKLAYRYIKELHARESFDLIHQVNVCTFREPGYGYKLGIPFLWGPVGGSQNFPVRFLSTLSAVEATKEGLRGLANRVTLWNPRVRRAARHATRLIAANTTNHHDYQRAFRREVDLLIETGLHHVAQPERSRWDTRVAEKRAGVHSSLRLLWSGELHTRKALPILLRALARVKSEVNWQLDVLGDGPMQEQWSAESARLGLGDRIRFLGRQTFTDAVAEMHTAHLFCFTSLRDTSGNVVLEALAAGVPVLCFDHQGAGDMVDASCGMKLRVTSPARAYTDWAMAVETLFHDPERLRALSYGATARARKFLWHYNQARVNAIYADLTNEPTGTAIEAELEPALEKSTWKEVQIC